MEELSHLSHFHPLHLISVDEIDDPKVIICAGCNKEITEGLVYYCKTCPYFLHKHCTEIPTHVTLPMHPQHPLYLYFGNYCFCNVCSVASTGFSYSCHPCSFGIDINCALVQRMEMHDIPGHDHPVAFHPRRASFFCNACGEVGEDASYQCRTCHFWIHEKCGKLDTARTMKHKCREHGRLLSLQTCIPEEYRSNRILCDVCGWGVHPPNWSYLCQDCKRFFHLKCLEGLAPSVTTEEDESSGHDDSPTLKSSQDDFLGIVRYLYESSESSKDDSPGKEPSPADSQVSKPSPDSPGSESSDDDSQGSESEISSTQHQEPMKTTRATMDELEEELSKMIGLNKLKEQLRSWVKQVIMDSERQRRGIAIPSNSPPHLALLGNPGTGKTTVARLLGKMLHKFGILPSDKFIEVRRTDLVAKYVGNTGPKTKKKIDEAEGGIMFVDEAYELTKTESKNDYGSEVIGEMMAAMDENKLSIIVAGYPEEIRHMFASSNPGFNRRISQFFQFDNLSCEELAEILQLKLNTEGSKFYGLQLESSCSVEEVGELIREMTTKDQRNNMNGGLVDQMLNNAKQNLDVRVFDIEDIDDDLLSTLTRKDLEVSLQMLKENHEISVQENTTSKESLIFSSYFK